MEKKELSFGAEGVSKSRHFLSYPLFCFNIIGKAKYSCCSLFGSFLE